MFTTSFFIIFLITVMFFFFCVRREWRVAVLAIASILFVFYLDAYAGIVLTTTSVCTYMGGHGIYWLQKKGKEKVAKLLTTVLVAADVAVIILYKFGLYFLERIGILVSQNEYVVAYLIIPIGLSFYTFQAISYLIDIYKKKYSAEENFIEFMLYMSYFPKFVSGPIERVDDFTKQLDSIKNINFMQSGRLSIAFTYMLYGYFMKIVVADRVAVTVNKIFEYPQGYDSFWLVLGIILYTVQIYADFAGYSYIAVGVSKIFGIDIQMNFKNPYFSYNITEFWRKWHISLSSWLRDYLYIPLGGNRKGKVRKNINTMIVFIVCGLWHGTGINFLIWGFLHGIYSVMQNVFWAKGKKTIWSRLFTLIQVAIAWVFFKASSASAAINYFYQIFVQKTSAIRIRENFMKLDLNAVEIWVVIGSVVIMFLADGWADKQDGVFPEVLQKKNRGIRYCVFYALLMIVFVFGIYGTGYNAESFIYMQF